MNVEKLKLPIIERRIIAEKTREISFGLSGKEFIFLAGQYIRVSVPNLLHADPRGQSRLFSILCSANDKNKISIAFRDSGSGFKRTLIELPLGSTIGIEGPFGYFTLPKDVSSSLVFLTGGIGIAPLLSMIRFAVEQKLTHQITLLYSNKNLASAAYLEELKTISEQNNSFLLKNKFGHIDADFIQQYVKNLAEPVWYIVGPSDMVADMRSLLSRLGVSEAKIYSEDLIGY